MATTTLVLFREEFSESIGDWISSTTTSAGAAGGTTLVDSSLTNLSGDDDYFAEFWCSSPLATPVERKRR